MIDPDSIPVEREIWAAPDGLAYLSGNGTKDKPYSIPGGDLDALLPLLGASCRLHLLAGEFVTRYFFHLPKTLLIHGAGMGVTTIKLADGATSGLYYPHVRMITDGGQFFTHFAATDLTLDGNWAGQPEHPNLKVQALAIQACRAHVRNVEIINCGANGTANGNAGLEAMPISLQTFANGNRELYFPSMEFLWGTEPTTRLEAIDCRVSLPHFVKGGTWTGIYIRTSLPANRQPAGTRTTEAALVRGCTVVGSGGICFGGADLDYVTFEDNTGEGMCAFNCDTLRADRVRIRNNRFFDCNTGINVSPSGNGQQVHIDGNFVQLGKPFWNAVMNRFEPQWGIQGKFLTKSRANRNTILVPDAWGFTPLSGIDGAINRIIETGTAENSGALVQAKSEIAALKTEASRNLTAIADLNGRLSSMSSANQLVVEQSLRLQSAILKVKEAVQLF